MLISLVKAVSEMCSTVFVRFLFVQLKSRLHFQVTTISGAAVINEIENSCHYIELSRIFLNRFLFPTSLNLYCHISKYRVSLLVSSWPQQTFHHFFLSFPMQSVFFPQDYFSCGKEEKKILMPLITNHQTNWIVMFNV